MYFWIEMEIPLTQRGSVGAVETNALNTNYIEICIYACVLCVTVATSTFMLNSLQPCFPDSWHSNPIVQCSMCKEMCSDNSGCFDLSCLNVLCFITLGLHISSFGLPRGDKPTQRQGWVRMPGESWVQQLLFILGIWAVALWHDFPAGGRGPGEEVGGWGS